MPRNSVAEAAFFALIPLIVYAQGTRPEAGPFQASQLHLESPPPEGFVVRAGRLFDPKSGTNLSDQVILVRADRITEVGPAGRVKIPTERA